MISVIVPAYNEGETIRRCMQALSRQTVPRDMYELIVVDGNSEDNTREIAAEYADIVFIQESERVPGARNDGFLRAKYDILATTDADSLVAPDWIEHILATFSDPGVVCAFGPVTPIQDTRKNRRYVLLFNTLMKVGSKTRLFYYTLGCNTAFRSDAFRRAGMYRIMDAGDDLEVSVRMRRRGRVRFDPGMKVGFDFRRYEQFGFWKTIIEWYVIVLQGGISRRFSYTKRAYHTPGAPGQPFPPGQTQKNKKLWKLRLALSSLAGVSGNLNTEGKNR
ncbi:glycosyltransferase involved in cell wall biosynthesis [Methanolinea mesophila]|uniref:glycosyltransferase n=1 Tax=Methanolinea mesophila TaxID=547055 RepID=UPI001AE1F5A2|nr:glycosyltransferase involved in cell wall biosynthesis [Methanolinea mesophila]